MPVIRTKGMEIIKDLDYPPSEQLWADPMYYELRQDEIPKMQSLHQRLKTIPLDYLDVAIKRFNRSYGYWLKDEIDDCFADLVIALESLTSRGGEGILQSMKLRIPLLLKTVYKDRKKLEKEIGVYYDHRSMILHGGKIDESKREKRTEILEDLRNLVRNTIVACTGVLENAKLLNQLQKTMAETIDAYIYQRLTAM
jgi:hypothetical protein